MRAKKAVYWIATIFAGLIMTASGAMAVIHAPAMMKALEHLGYPVYFSNLLGVTKLVGVVVLLAPGWARFKEWAYVGFGITVLSGFYSHLMSGDGVTALDPLVTFAALVISYWTRPDDRRFFSATSVAMNVPEPEIGVAGVRRNAR